ncbi:hypothetical protein SAY86_019201 [Trapa natans]|uniref:Glycosyltransferase n=1 Tax=Trapa natans TaxID=22666 RepID=A0AAN7R3W1_TRANT|nr:hypothetical protein SAY86_019201 [Trapa natans]
MSCEVQAVKRPHAVCVPCPPQGHLNAMLQLAKLLHWKGFHVSFVIIESEHNRMVTARGDPSFLDGLPSDFQLVTFIPDVFPSPPNHDIQALGEFYRNHTRGPFADLISSLNQRAAIDMDFPAVSIIVSDSLMTFSTIPAGEKFGIPVVNFWPFSASVTMCFMQLSELMARGLDVDGPSSDCYLDTIVDWIPGINHMRLRDFPCFLRNAGSVDDLEVLNAFSLTLSKPVYAIGPLPLALELIPGEDYPTKNIKCSLWEENSQCLQWLDSKEPNSVLYINFGSIATLTPQQVTEFATGIANSGHPFLWIIRPTLVAGEAAVFPPDFVEKTKGRGFTAGWCPQENVLNHRSIGGFLTHCGWNSTMESLSAGVPMLCWPFFADQHTNCWIISTNCGIGLEIDHDVKRDEVTSLVKELMEGVNGKEVKERALEWKKRARESVDQGGSSWRGFERLLREMLSK